MSMVTTTSATNCSYCNLACSFSIVKDDLGIIGIDHQKGGPYQGKLCARGSGNEILIKSKKRLSTPISSAGRIDWTTTFDKISELINRYQEKMVITLGSELTVDEYKLIAGFGKALGIQVIPLNIDGGNGFRYKLKNIKKGTIDDISKVERLITIGDVFGVGPIIAQPILEFRYRKDTRHYHIDSLPSSTQIFADHHLSLIQNAEVATLNKLAHGKGPEGSEEFFNDVKDKSTLVITALNKGRVLDPVGFSLATQSLAKSLGAKIIMLANHFGWPGEGSLESILSGVKSNKIKLIFNFGEELLAFADSLKRVKTISTSLFSIKAKRSWINIPAALNCEKEGQIQGLSGMAKVKGEVNPPSGVYQIEKIISELAKRSKIKVKPVPYKPNKYVTVDYLEQRIEEVKSKKRSKNRFRVFGIPSPINFLDLFDQPNYLYLNPKDLVKLKLNDYNNTQVGSKTNSIEVIVKGHPWISEGTVLINSESKATWPLFSMFGGYLVPGEVKIWKGKST